MTHAKCFVPDYESIPMRVDNVHTARAAKNRARIALTWKNVSLEVENKHKEGAKTQILNSISGFCPPGQLLAIMGPSGAGKTSLLNLLSHREKNFTGSILYNGNECSPILEKLTAYVPQTDVFYPELTVHEHLMFQARLRMSPSLSPKERDRTVLRVLKELGLNGTAHIGVLGETGISGGERRRLTFANEILNNPALLFLDEPTSGLDSSMAQQVMMSVRKLAADRTVVCTIHQPAPAVFGSFDLLLLLARTKQGGQVAYFGPVSQVMEYFAGTLGITVPAFANPADVILDAVALLPEPQPQQSSEHIESVCEKFRASSLNKTLFSEIKQLTSEDTKQTDVSSFQDDEDSGVGLLPWCEEFSILLRRSFLNVTRNKMLFRGRLVRSIVLGTLIGIVYSKVTNNQTSIQDKTGAVFFALIQTAIASSLSVLSVFPQDLQVFAREYRSNLYRIDTYFLSVIFSGTPHQILAPLIEATIMFWLIGFGDISKYIEFVSALVLVGLVAQSLGMLVSASASRVENALTMAPIVLMPLILFGGFLVNLETVPIFLAWISDISFFRFGFEVLNIVVWREVTLECDHDVSLSNSSGYISCVLSGEQVVDNLGLNRNKFVWDLFALAGLYFLHLFVAFILMLRRARKAKVSLDSDAY